MSQHPWRDWNRLRVQYARQALASDLLALGVGVLLGWWLL